MSDRFQILVRAKGTGVVFHVATYERSAITQQQAHKRLSDLILPYQGWIYLHVLDQASEWDLVAQGGTFIWKQAKPPRKVKP